MMKVKNRQLLQGLMNPVQTAEGQAVGVGQALDGTQEQEELSAREILKRALESMYDPVKDMTEEDHAAYQEKLMKKIQTGKKLTAQEMNYLRIHDPSAYRLARRMEYKRMKLEQKLKNCRSKEEAQEVFDQSMEGISKDDPDREVLMNTYKEAYEEFKKTMQYARLPETKKEAEAQRLHGNRKKAYLVGEDYTELQIDMIFDTMKEDYEWTEDGLVRLEEDESPLVELLDNLPVMDIVG